MRVRAWYLLAMVLMALILQAGCGPTLVLSTVDRAHQWESAIRADMRTITQDVDLVLMMDRPTRLSKWRVN